MMASSYNILITFGANGTAQGLNCTGIDFSDGGDQSWTSAPVAELDVLLPPARQDIVVQIEASPFLIPDVVFAQQVFIFIGGLFVGFYVLRGHQVREFPLTRGIVSGRQSRMTLTLPNAMSPSAASLSADLRELGICLRAIAFNTIQ
jgi:hypothetical protein